MGRGAAVEVAGVGKREELESIDRGQQRLSEEYKRTFKEECNSQCV